MRLKTFRFSNLFSLDKGEIHLENQGLVLITGFSEDEGSSNGSGKSSLSSKGICWTLYGQTPGGIKADTVVNRHVKKKSAWGEIEYFGVDGQTYKIRRERPSKLKFWVLNPETEEFDSVALRKSNETQEQIDRSLGRDFQTFVQTEFFGQGRLLSYASLTPANQKAVLEQILPMERLEIWAERSKELARQVKERVQEVEKEYIGADVQTNSAHQQVQSLEHKITQWDANQERAKKELQAVIDTNEERTLRLKNQIREIDQKLNQFVFLSEEKINEINHSHQEILDKLKHADEQIEYIKNARLNLEQEKFKYRAAQIHIDLGNQSTCPTCYQEITSEHMTQIEHRNRKSAELQSEAENNIEYCNTSLGKWLTYQSELRGHCDFLAGQLSDDKAFQLQYSSLENKKNALQSELQESPAMKAAEKIKQIEQEEDPYTSLLEDAQKAFKEFQEKSKEVETDLNKLNRELGHFQFWQKAYGGDMRLRLFELACPFLENRTMYHLNRLGNAQIKVQFSTVKVLASGEAKEDFNVRVWSETGGEGYESLSGGEQQMVSFAIGRSLADLARSQTTGQSFFQILDEPFSMLDARNSENIVNYLNEEMRGGTVLLVSNEEHLKSLVPKRIHVTKKDGISHAQSAA